MSDINFPPPPDGTQGFTSTKSANFSDDYNPLDESVNEKPYSQPNFSANSQSLNSPIPEPSYAPPPIGKEDAYKEINKENSGKSGNSGEKEAINPALNEVSSEEKKMAATHLANIIIDGYSQANSAVGHFAKFPEKKVNELVAEGEINLDAPITYDYGTTITGKDFIKTYNDSVKDVFVVSEDFKKEVKPVLIRVLEKRGAGLSDEQFLIYAFGKDMSIKGVQFYQLRSQVNTMIETMRDYSKAYAENNAPKGQPLNPEDLKRRQYQETEYPPVDTDNTRGDYKKNYTKDYAKKESFKEDSINEDFTREEETYSSSYSEPEEVSEQPNPTQNQSFELIKREDSEKKDDKTNKGHKVRKSHFSSGKRKNMKKKDDNITDAEIVDENPLD
jgi:hypothetical protein